MANFNEIGMLMAIASNQPNFPSFPRIHSAVMTRLAEIEAELTPKPEPKPEPKVVPSGHTVHTDEFKNQPRRLA